MGRHRKVKEFKVGLSREDTAALQDLARLERDVRKDPELGGATLLREYAMPRVHERLAELKAAEQARREQLSLQPTGTE